MTALDSRDPREFLSKSFLTGLDWCGWAQWWSIHEPRPFIRDEGIVFGSAVDAGTQAIITMKRAGDTVDMDRALTPAAAILNETDIPVDALAVQVAIEQFVRLPFDWTFAKVQHHIRLEVPGLGMVDAHPDIILRDGSVYDVKTSKRSKAADAAEKSYRELGFYALLRQYETGETPPHVGYITWVRSQKPYWQVVEAPVTDRMLRVAYLTAQGVARALQADQMLNEGLAEPVNAVFTSGPAWPGKCATCPYAPYNGGRCEIAEEVRDAA